VFAHSFIISGAKDVTFIDRSRGGDYAAKKHTFTVKEFADHVTAFTKDCADLEQTLGITKAELHAFAMAALSANTNSAKSPVPPNESK
jgi:hypothetical protein